jgi:hypothetical protein
MSARDAFEYIVDRILKKRCVPVAGAGISLSSEHPDGYRFHNVKWMVGEVKRSLLNKRHARYDRVIHGSVCKRGCVGELKACGLSVDESDLNGSNCFFCDVKIASESDKLGNLSELYLWEFDDINDAYKSLVKLLRIDIYKDLKPTPAHTIVAKLVGEELLGEVLTTNYDCNFERAYDKLSGGENSDVISNLDDYRRIGAKFGGVNRLKVYKINGCADKLGDGSDPKKCESILLTERQLQKWRNRQWAADVFRDRLRSRSFLFIGFGSDEPQVHHTLQAVLDEYTDDLIDNDSPVLDTPAAPVVAIFDPQPSFHQQQIVNTYALHHQQPANQGDELIIRHPMTGGTLSADELLKLIYERVMRVTVIEALKTSLKAMNASFTSIVPFSQVILHQVISSLENSVNHDIEFFTAAPDWLVALSSNAGNPTKKDELFATLVGSLTALNGQPRQQYSPVNENKSLMSEFITLLFLLRDVLSPHIESDTGNGLSLAFKASTGNSAVDKLLYLNADPTVVSSGDEVSVPSSNNHLSLALGQAGSRVRPSLRRVVNKSKTTDSITPKTIVTLGWQHIFYQKPYDGNKDTVARTLIDAVESPSNYFYANQPSIKRRTYLREV